MTLTGSGIRLPCTPARSSSELLYQALIEFNSLLETAGHRGNLIMDLASPGWIQTTAGTQAVIKLLQDARTLRYYYLPTSLKTYLI